jgi:hypothetical protein
MNPVHPYLNPQENPANALNRLLQHLPPGKQNYGINEIQLCEANCFQARRTQDTQAAWAKEAARRDAQIDAGEVETIPGEVVFAKLYAKLI